MPHLAKRWVRSRLAGRISGVAGKLGLVASPLRVPPPLFVHSCLKLWPAASAKFLNWDSIERDDAQEIERVIVKDGCQT